MSRGFKKISFKQFKEDVDNDQELYLKEVQVYQLDMTFS